MRKRLFLGLLSLALWSNVSIAASEQKVAEADKLWQQNWELADHKPFDFLLLCYSATADTVKAELLKQLGDNFEPHFVLAGGNAENAELAISLCNKDIRKLNLFNDERVYSDAEHAFRTLATVMDVKMLKECQSKECKEVEKSVFEKEN